MLLNRNNLTHIAETTTVPGYDLENLKTGIVHIGVGGFHRSHQAYYIHRLLEEYNALDWGICGVGLREADQKMKLVLEKQGGLYTLITQHPNGRDSYEVVGSIHEFLLASESRSRIVDKMAHPDTRIVSLTITEGGYNFNPATGEFDFDNHEIKEELAFPDAPKTVYGFLTNALKKRKKSGLPPFTILSCDNIQHNGNVTKKMLLAFAQKQDPELANWIKENVCFPNSMVDRITPVTTAGMINQLKTDVNIEDRWPVVCEPFIQWVIEDRFSFGRPALEKVGVQFVSDVTPYEKIKIRLLNAGHSVLGILGALHGHSTIDACMNDSVFATFMNRYMDEEVTPVLGEVEGIDLNEYKDSLAERFANPNIKDSVSRICSESSAKLPKFLIPTLQENLEAGGNIDLATFVLAAWCYYSDKGINEKNEPLEIIDVKKLELQNAAKNTSENPISFLELTEIFGSLRQNKRFCEKYERAVLSIYKEKKIRRLMDLI